ncbi:MAG TPA: hypothetical protein VK158_03000 [Acidobacteriota bacterium]|nr:hypothetical protein [Acidobacteriota bacterium]
MRKLVGILIILLTFLVTFSPFVSAVPLNLANSRDWIDVYSVMMAGSLTNVKSQFSNTESISALSRTFTVQSELTVYESTDQAFIPNLASQLSTAGYVTQTPVRSDDFNLDLDPQNGRYIVLSDSNYRTSIAVASYAKKIDAWVLFVNDDNVDEIASRLEDATSVLAVGPFPRSVLNEIEPTFDEWINTNNVFGDSQAIALKHGSFDTVILADGQGLESEFFSTANPVLLSGPNRILDDTFDFLTKNKVKSVIIVSNQLAVVGEQIRSRSNKTISVFVKFAQSDTKAIGTIYALTIFPLPQPTIGIDISKAEYDPVQKTLVAYFKNVGSIGAYALTTINVKSNGREVGTTSQETTTYLASGEALPVQFQLNINPELISENMTAEFYTSFGSSPFELDSFLTLRNKFGPPFSIPLTLADLPSDSSQLSLTDVTYFTSLKRIGVEVQNNGTSDIHYIVKVNGLIVNGLSEDFSKQDIVKAGAAKTTYMSAQLDDIDLEENKVFNVTIVYGTDANLLLKTIRATPDFKTSAGGAIPLYVYVIIILIIILAVFAWIHMRRKNTPSG